MYASRAQHQSRNDSALHALRRLSTIASALGHPEERIPDDVSTRGDVDACSRASRAPYNYKIKIKPGKKNNLSYYPLCKQSTAKLLAIK